LKLLSFTGSPDVGWAMKAQAGKKKVVLELGGNAACIVDADQNDQLDHIVSRLIFGGFYQSGQSCVHVQRVLVHQSLFDALLTRLIPQVQQLRCGDPRALDTDLGPMISEREAERVEAWVAQARAHGAIVHAGGARQGVMMQATLVSQVPQHLPVYAEEVFGPVMMLEPYAEFAQAIEQVNRSRFGLQAGLFSFDMRHIQQAWDQLEVGGLIVGDIPSWRADAMPYGGIKDSGFGREGIRYAIADMTEIRLMVLREH
jgi:acyl-CoA reductase-like NAD-dependent aldehyde dehydrogenase